MGTERNTNKKTFDIDKKTFDFTVMRGPELPFNAYTHPPGPMENEEEIDAHKEGTNEGNN